MHWFHKSLLLYAKVKSWHSEPVDFAFQRVDFT